MANLLDSMIEVNNDVGQGKFKSCLLWVGTFLFEAIIFCIFGLLLTTLGGWQEELLGDKLFTALDESLGMTSIITLLVLASISSSLVMLIFGASVSAKDAKTNWEKINCIAYQKLVHPISKFGSTFCVATFGILSGFILGALFHEYSFPTILFEGLLYIAGYSVLFALLDYCSSREFWEKNEGNIAPRVLAVVWAIAISMLYVFVYDLPKNEDSSSTQNCATSNG